MAGLTSHVGEDERRGGGSVHLPKSGGGRAEEEGTLAPMIQREADICTVLPGVTAGRQTLEGGHTVWDGPWCRHRWPSQEGRDGQNWANLVCISPPT